MPDESIALTESTNIHGRVLTEVFVRDGLDGATVFTGYGDDGEGRLMSFRCIGVIRTKAKGYTKRMISKARIIVPQSIHQGVFMGSLNLTPDDAVEAAKYGMHGLTWQECG